MNQIEEDKKSRLKFHRHRTFNPTNETIHINEDNRRFSNLAEKFK